MLFSKYYLQQLKICCKYWPDQLFLFENLIIIKYTTIYNNNQLMGEQKVYTWKEVAQHNSETNLWIVINGAVYDVTQYANQHPGGPIVLSSKAGRQSSIAFEQASHSKNAIENIQPKYKIGIIDNQSPMEEWQKQPKGSSPNILVTVFLVAFILAAIYLLAA